MRVPHPMEECNPLPLSFKSEELFPVDVTLMLRFPTTTCLFFLLSMYKGSKSQQVSLPYRQTECWRKKIMTLPEEKGRKTDGCAHTLLDLFKNTNTEFVQNILLQNFQTFPKTNRPFSPIKLALLSYTHTTGTLSRHTTLNQIQKGFKIKSFSYAHLITHCWPFQFFPNPLLQIICWPLLSNSQLSKTLAKVPFSPIFTAWKTLIPQTLHIFKDYMNPVTGF